MKLSEEIATKFVYSTKDDIGYNPMIWDCTTNEDINCGFELVIPCKLLYQRRFYVHSEVIIKDIETGKFYKFECEMPGTEAQDLEFCGDVELVEVFPKTVEVVVYNEN